MSVKLTGEQWGVILNHRNREAPAEDCVERVPVPLYTASSGAHNPNVVYLMFLQADDPDPRWSLAERVIDATVQALQPYPVMTHVEMIVPCAAKDDYVHFATYLGRNGGWGDVDSFKDGRSFYLDNDHNGKSWRAVPVVLPNAALRMRKECSMHETTPYGRWYNLYHYPFSAPPMRWFAWSVANKRRSPAHCACLTARCLSMGLPELSMLHPSTWYGPSTLFLEMSRTTNTLEFQSHLSPTSESDPSAVDSAAEALLYGTDDDILGLGEAHIGAAHHRLTEVAIRTALEGDGEATQRAQLSLARALLRWSVVYRSSTWRKGP